MNHQDKGPNINHSTSVSTCESRISTAASTSVLGTAPAVAAVPPAPTRNGPPIQLMHQPWSREELEWLEANGGGQGPGKMSWEECVERFTEKFGKHHPQALEDMWKELQSQPRFSVEQREWIEANGGGMKMSWEECVKIFQEKFQRKIHQGVLEAKWAEWKGECGTYVYSVFRDLMYESKGPRN